MPDITAIRIQLKHLIETLTPESERVMFALTVRDVLDLSTVLDEAVNYRVDAESERRWADQYKAERDTAHEALAKVGTVTPWTWLKPGCICIFCDATDAEGSNIEHKEDCPWVFARALLLARVKGEKENGNS